MSSASTRADKGEYENILLPVSGENDGPAIKLACNLAKLAKRSKCHILVLYVIQVQRSLPLDASIESEIGKAEQTLGQVEDQMVDCPCELDTDILQARDIGVAIVDEAVEKHADLILMGAGYKKRFGASGIGPTALTVLRDAPCPVVVVRPALMDQETR
ncbi:MAG TPA: universal stress protein [Dehalococcoidia bacterium]|nr:universal stress protein [Dehalococcoidia bacterium]